MATTNDEPMTYTKQMLAQALRVSVRTLERMRQGGFLPPTLPGLKRPRWAAETIREWLRESGKRK